VVAKTRAKAPSTAVQPRVRDVGSADPETDENEADAEESAEVIPLPVFDARKEADKWW
jgi:putative transposase